MVIEGSVAPAFKEAVGAAGVQAVRVMDDAGSQRSASGGFTCKEMRGDGVGVGPCGNGHKLQRWPMLTL